MKILTALVAAIGLILLNGARAQAQDTHYAPWQGQVQTGDMPELLKNLRALTDQADRDKAADPAFLADLRKLIADYENRNRWPVRLLFDDFRDGEIASNPAWTVVAGTWQVKNMSGVNLLVTSVRAGSANNTSSNSGSTGNIVAGVLGTLLKQQGGQGQNQPGQATPASIVAPVAISDQFLIRLELFSRDKGGQFNFGPYAGKQAEDSYQVAYLSGAQSGLVLSRVSSQGSQILGQSQGPVVLEDSQQHVIEWRRGPAGKMTVLLDGRPAIEATDTQIHTSFSGFSMIDSGGSYGIRSVAINGVRQ